MAEETAIRKSPFGMLLGALVRPGTTFRHLREHQPRSWWLPAVVVIICVLLPLGASALGRQGQDGPVTMLPATEGGIVAPESDAVSRDMPVGPVGPGGPETPSEPAALRVLKTVAAVVGTPLTWLIWGGALYLTSVFLGRSSTFGTMTRLVIWTWLPYAVRGIVQAVYIWITGQAITNSGFAGYVIDSATPSIIPPGPGTLALAGVLGRVDIYMVWNLVLLMVGLQAFTGLPRRKSVGAVLIIWVVLALLGVIPAIVGGLFGSMGL